MSTYAVRDDATLSGLRTAYLQACESGERALTVEVAAGAYGLDPDTRPGSLSLAGGGPPALDVTLRCTDGGLAVLVGFPLVVAARRVTIEGVAIDGAVGGALALTVAEAVTLRDVTVLGATGDPQWTRAVVELQAAGPAGASAELERVTVASSSAGTAAIMLAVAGGAWWERVTLAEVDVADVRADALLALEAVRMMQAHRTGLDARASNRLVRLDQPITGFDEAQLVGDAGEIAARVAVATSRIEAVVTAAK